MKDKKSLLNLKSEFKISRKLPKPMHKKWISQKLDLSLNFYELHHLLLIYLTFTFTFTFTHTFILTLTFTSHFIYSPTFKLPG